jgi:hypothetical protein
MAQIQTTQWMSTDSNNSFHEPAKAVSTQTLTLVLDYRLPSLNVTRRRHWSQWQTEKKRAWAALHCALQAAVSDPLTPTIWVDRLKMSLTAFGGAAAFMGIARGKSSYKSGKKKSPPTILNKPS